MSRKRLSSPTASRDTESSSKRKRDIIPEDEDDKLEIDVNLPEPPSKKAKRKEKKLSKSTASNTEASAESATPKVEADNTTTKAITVAPKRSDHGVWIGNLPFDVTKDTLRQFLKDKGGIGESDVSRVHLPSGEKGKNKGFAYVDVTTPSVLQIALSLSEEMIGGRRVLIKDAKSFEGRPEKATNSENQGNQAGDGNSKKEPSKRVFVGNLGFDITKDELTDHFAQAGLVEEVFMATFQDTGKCKGFGWIRFATIEAAENAVRGFIRREPEDQDEAEEHEHASADQGTAGDKPQKAKKHRKHFINRIQGRTLRCEFAEDPQTRYKKRFGQKSASTNNGNPPGHNDKDSINDNAASTRNERPSFRKLDKDERREERRKRHDARTIAPGQALARAQRATAAIVAGAGKKVTFE